MCQLTPITYPCCRKVYVLVGKVPSCPDNWPESKCPQELCIEVWQKDEAGEKHPDNREYGTCWRCKARMLNLKGAEYERMRPAIDKARVAKGLDELDVSGRRRRVEEGGHCWFCNARGGCQTCGADMIVPINEDQHTGYAARKRGRKELETDEAYDSVRAGKRVKRENTATPQGRSRASARPSVPAWSASPNTVYLESQASPSTYSDPGPSAWSTAGPQAGNFVGGSGSSPGPSNYGLPNPSRKKPLYNVPPYTGEHLTQGSPPQNFMSSPPSGQAYGIGGVAPGNFQGDDGWHDEGIHAGMNQGQPFPNQGSEIQFLDPQLFDNDAQTDQAEAQEQEQGDNVRDVFAQHPEFATPRMNSARK